MSKIKVLALGGSVRATGKMDEKLLELVHSSSNLEDFIKNITPFTKREQKTPFSNTEVLAGAALMGAKSLGHDVDYFSLKSIFPRMETPLSDLNPEALGLNEDVDYIDWLSISQKDLDRLIDKINNAHGVVLASPVYFGDRSSVANKFFQIAAKHQLLESKVLGCVTAGAKRNGGQETTNIFSLFEGLNLGSYIVGNGPKTSQYGGTCIAGDIGNICEDTWGLETCFGTGVRTAHVSEIVDNSHHNESKEKVRISVLVSMDNSKRLLSQKVDEYIQDASVKYPDIEFNKVDLIETNIYRCLACNICPIPELMEKRANVPEAYACIINSKKDGMEKVREILLKSDGIVMAGLNLKDMSDVQYRYQAFMERTRFIRRNDFELTNNLFTGLFLNELGGRQNPIFDLKVMTSYMRHNGIMSKPVTEFLHDGKVLQDDKAGFRRFVKQTIAIKNGRKETEGLHISYKAGGDGGYADTRLDSTSAVRS